jgi:hypothetical protein
MMARSSGAGGGRGDGTGATVGAGTALIAALGAGAFDGSTLSAIGRFGAAARRRCVGMAEEPESRSNHVPAPTPATMANVTIPRNLRRPNIELQLFKLFFTR